MYFTSLIGGFGAAAAARTGWLRIPQRLPIAATISSRWPLEACLLAQDHDGSRAATRGCWSPQGAGAEKVQEKRPPAIASPGGPRARRSSKCSCTQRGGCEVPGWRLSGKWEKMSRGGEKKLILRKEVGMRWTEGGVGTEGTAQCLGRKERGPVSAALPPCRGQQLSCEPQPSSVALCCWSQSLWNSSLSPFLLLKQFCG